MSKYTFVPMPELPVYTDRERVERARDYYAKIRRRRTIREFSPEPVPRHVLELCVQAAGTAPNGANLQPWHFCVVQDPQKKHEIRAAAEAEEREFYHQRATRQWLDDLAPLGTDEHKPFLEIAPALIVIFAQAWRIDAEGNRRKNYYVSESVGIATGFLINALHECGLATLTHTPSPMKFLNRILGRPENERPYLILVTGMPAANVQVPAIEKRPLDEIATFI